MKPTKPINWLFINNRTQVISGGNILEWNVYRYQQQQIENENMVILYAYSYRNYVATKEDVTKFMDYVKNNENKMVETITKTNIPKVKIK